MALAQFDRHPVPLPEREHFDDPRKSGEAEQRHEIEQAAKRTRRLKAKERVLARYPGNRADMGAAGRHGALRPAQRVAEGRRRRGDDTAVRTGTDPRSLQHSVDQVVNLDMIENVRGDQNIVTERNRRWKRRSWREGRPVEQPCRPIQPLPEK